MVVGLTTGTCGFQMIRKSELLKKDKKLGESRIFFIFGIVTWSCRKKYEVVSCFFIYICWIDWEHFLFLGEASCELMTGKLISKVDDLPDEDTDVSTSQNP